MAQLTWQAAQEKLQKFSKKIVVKKYGGATLETVANLKRVAAAVAEEHRQGHALVVAVSAMGKTTNQLIDLAHQVSAAPSRREMDMLLSAGERTSMALLTMALNDLNVPAISFTGSQAGVITTDSHEDAHIIDMRPQRVVEALLENKVAVIAGFQGVSDQRKEVTTLGRGGTDLTAIAMACALNAECCEILKEVSGVSNADPQLFGGTQEISELNYQQLLNMTFWGARVIQYRAAEMAAKNQLPLFVGRAFSEKREGTMINKRYEKLEVTAVTGFSRIALIELHAGVTIASFLKLLTEQEIPHPQLLAIDSDQATSQIATGESTSPYGFRVWAAAPTEIMNDLAELKAPLIIKDLKTNVASLTVSGGAFTNTENLNGILEHLDGLKIKFSKMIHSPKALTFFISGDQFHPAHEALQKMLTKIQQ